MGVKEQEARNRVRILSDLHISQLPWWGQRVTLLRGSGRPDLLSQFKDALDLVRLARRHDVVITANVRNALALGLFKRLTFRRKPRHMMVEMRLDDQVPGLAWQAKLRLQRFAYATVDRMCVSAHRERTMYSQRLRVPLERTQFVPWHTNVLQPGRQDGLEGYVLSAGRTGRDWKTLAAAVTGTDIPVVVVCDRKAAQGVSFPPNVTVLMDIPYDRYRELLRRARAVILPLEPHVYSSGQVVILEAMALAKPLIVSKVVGTEDYVQDGKTGLLVEPENPLSLRQALQRLLSDPQLETALTENGLQEVMRRHTLDGYARTIIGVAEELVGSGA